MKTVKSLFNYFTGKQKLVEDNVSGSGSYLLDRVTKLKNRFARTFFHQSIICCITDAFEYFLEINEQNNVFYRNIMLITEKASEKFIKWETIYHTLMFSEDLENVKDVVSLENSLFYIFDISDNEREVYSKFKEQLAQQKTDFPADFSNAAALDIFGLDKIDNFDASFIYNFYYSCYTEFYKAYSKYTLVNNTLKDNENLCLSVLQTSK